MAMTSSMPMFLVDSSNAAAVPWKLPWMESGMPIASLAWRMPLTASDSALPGARSKEMVTAGIWPAWLTESGTVLAVILVTAVSGTSVPLAPVM